MASIGSIARFVSGTGLGAVGALHVLWAAGSTWPVSSREALAEAVVGNADAMPEKAPTAVVGGMALIGGAATSGLLGEGKLVGVIRAGAAIALLMRAAFGGGAALKSLNLPPAGARFVRLDTRFYRPLCLVLGVATLIGLLTDDGES